MLIADYFRLISVVSYRIVVFFDPRDVARFECACSNRELYSQFRRLLSRNTVSDLTYTLNSATWILQRNVYPTTVLIGRFVSEADVVLFTEVASKVREIEFKDAIISHRAFCALVKHCPHLHKFDTCATSFMSVPDYIRITKSCSSLVDLSIHLPSLTRTDLRSILAQCSQLTALNVINCKLIDVNYLVEDLSTLSPKLESLTANQFFVQHPYPVLADHFPRLKRLHFEHASSFLPADPISIDSMFGRCVPLVELVLNNLTLTDVTLWRILQRSAHLQVFRYTGTGCTVSTARMVHMSARCIDLRELDVTCIEYNADSAIAAVTKQCSTLHTLTLRNCSTCSDSALDSIATHCTRYLHKLDLLQCTNFTATSIQNVVRQCSSLTHLQLSRYKLCSRELGEMVSHCSQLVRLELREPYWSIDDSVVYAICVHLKYLKHLHFSGYHVVVTELALVRLLTTLNTIQSVHIINVNRVYCDLRIVAAIDHCHCLKELHVGYCSEAVHKAFAKLRIRCVEQKRDLVVEAMTQFSRACC